MQKNRKFIINILGLIVIFTFSYLIYKFTLNNISAQKLVVSFGYLGALVVGIVCGFNFAIPVPAIAFTPIFYTSGLDFFWLALVFAIGMTVADVIEYMVAGQGWNAVHNTRTLRVVARLKKWRTSHPVIPLFALFGYTAFAPAPNELSLPIFASLGYSVFYIIPVAILGNFVFNIIYGFTTLKLFSF